MITELQFENFRGFRALSVSPLKRVNLIAGANNTGKTGLLEGLVLLFDSNEGLFPVQMLPGSFRSSLMPGQSTQDDYPTFWENLFFDREASLVPQIVAREENGDLLSCNLTYTPNAIQINHGRIKPNAPSPSPSPPPRPPRPYVPMRSAPPPPPPFTWTVNANGAVGVSGKRNPAAQELIRISTRQEHPIKDAELFNQLTLRKGGEEELMALLTQIDPRLQKLRYAKAPKMSQPLVYAHFGMKNAISITQTGQGFSKLFSLFCRMLLSNARALFVDEIENGLYYEALPLIWKGIATLAASENIQVFATTHSRECIIAAHETMKSMPHYDFALHRLQRVKGEIQAVTHDEEMLDAAIESGLEVR